MAARGAALAERAWAKVARPARLAQGGTGTGGSAAGGRGGAASGGGGSGTATGGGGPATGGSGGTNSTAGSGGTIGWRRHGRRRRRHGRRRHGRGRDWRLGRRRSTDAGERLPVQLGPAGDHHPGPLDRPPGGLAVDNVPLFVSLGFDDNAYPDGMQWILDVMKSRVNPAGRGNPCTFDGAPARASFFNNSHVGEMTEPGIKDAHQRAYRDGHEAANHTDSHAETLQRNPDRALWVKELSTCTDYMVGLGIPRADIVGFRTPFLQQSEQTFEAIVDQKFRYDCSIEHFYGPGGFVWPYTLDGGKAPMHTYQTAPMGKYAGLWELPVYELMTTTTGYTSVTGFDYNIWISKRMTRAQAVDLFKASLQIRLAGGNSPANRAPLLIGAHTDLYSEKNTTANTQAAASVADRRAAIEEFLTWALTYHPAVRVVPYAEVLHWMQAPVGLDGTQGARAPR